MVSRCICPEQHYYFYYLFFEPEGKALGSEKQFELSGDGYE